MNLTATELFNENELQSNNGTIVHELDNVTNEYEHLPGNWTTKSYPGNGTREYQFFTMSDAGFTFVGCMLSMTWCLGSLLNGLCLFVFATNRRLRSPTNLFIMALNLCDFLMCFFGTPATLTSAWAHRWLWGPAACDLEGFLVYFLGLSSMYLLTAVAIDRYIAITKPLLARRISAAVALAACGCCYLVGFLWAIFPAFGWNEFELEGAGISCSVVWDSTDPVYVSYIWAIFFCCFLIPVGVIVFSYWGVLATLRNLNRNSVWDMNSRVAKRNLNVEKRMLKTSVLIVLCFIGFWTPYAAVSFITAFFGVHHIPTIFATIPPVIAKCQGLVDPIIYVATNNQVRTAMFKIVPCTAFQRRLLNKEGEAVKELDSGESQVPYEPSTKKRTTHVVRTKSSIGEEGSKNTKQNKVQPMENAVQEEVLEEIDKSDVTSIFINQSENNFEIVYIKTEGEDRL